MRTSGILRRHRLPVWPKGSPDEIHGETEFEISTNFVAMLRRREGASGPQIAEAMGWASHTVRGFLAGLATKGIQVDFLDMSARSVRTSNAPRAATPSTASPMRPGN